MSTSPERISAAAIADLLRVTDPYLSCDGCFRQLDTYAERVVADPRHEDVAMQVHLAACGVCADEAMTLLELLVDDAS